MSGQDIQKNLFQLIEIIFREIADFSDGLSDEQKKAAGSLDAWAAKDVFSHLVFWQEHFNRKLTNARSGEKVPSSGDYLDQVNDGVFIQHADQPFAEARQDLKDSLNRTVDLLREESPDDLLEAGRYDYLGERSLLNDALGTIGWHIPYHLAEFHIQTGNTQAAVDLQEATTKELRIFPGWDVNAVYNLACFYALNNDLKQALKNLRAAFDLKPDMRAWAKQDSDLDSLRSWADFKALMESG